MKRYLCLILIFIAAFTFAKPQPEVIERDYSWTRDVELIKEKRKHSDELRDKYLNNFSHENISVTLKKSQFKKNTVKIKYKNISDKDLYIERWAIAEDKSQCNDDFRITNSKKEKAEYIGIQTTPALFYEDIDFILIKAGQTIKREVDLSYSFKLDENETYIVRYVYGNVVSNTIRIND